MNTKAKPPKEPHVLGNRYVLQSQIGAGSMGAVYVARDRLTGELVGIKRIRTDPNHPTGNAPSPHDVRLHLAQEFEIMAQLRHPHIVPVLDYGFDAEHQPYLVMPYLRGNRDLMQAASRAPLSKKIAYLVQLLRALEYLHQREITHRDLKPANILIDADDRVIVLDFGLAIAGAPRQANASSNALYLAPEVLSGGDVTPPSDLYAVGVIAYQLLTGSLPYGLGDLSRVVAGRYVARRRLPAEAAHLTPFITKLLALQPTARPASANACIAELEQLTEQVSYTETDTIRESFLQTARFVGRQAELTTLKQALEATFAGDATAWLIGGESGVGKSRLIAELRTYALVRGALVLHGQALHDGGLPYQLWRAVVPRLLLQTDPAEGDAPVLQAIVPDINRLLGYDASSAPADLNVPSNQQRFALALVTLFKQSPHPIVLFLEDLQWAGEGLAPLQQLLTLHDQLPHVLIVATYRDDEMPALPNNLPNMRLLKLARLDKDSVAQLAQSILGDGGKREALVDFLWQETEGNTFFMVEIVRALAEETGKLTDISTMALPQTVFTGGLHQLMQRRLERIPALYRPVLDCAAVAGRILDLRLLTALSNTISLDDFLLIGVNSSVLEVSDGIWRFAHDKLREHLVQQIDPVQRRELHQQIAATLEQLHPDDQAYDGILADHWLDGAEPQCALPFALRAIDRDLSMNNYTIVLNRAQRLLSALPEEAPVRSQLLIALANAHQVLGNFDQALQHFQDAAFHTSSFVQTDVEADALRGAGVIYWYQGQYTEARAHLAASLALFRQLNNARGIASCLNNLGIVAISDGDLEGAHPLLEESLARYRQISDDRGIASVLNNLGLISDARKTHDQSRRYYEETRDIFRKLQDQWGVALAYHNLGTTLSHQGDYAAAQAYLEQSIEIQSAIGDRHGLALSLITLAQSHFMRGAAAEAETPLAQGLLLGRQLRTVPVQVAAVAGYGVLFALREQYAPAVTIARFLKTQVIGADTAGYDLAALLVAHLEAHFGAEALQAEIAHEQPLPLDELIERWLLTAAP
ncbi:MAG: tetratricopeptide repeat protein [Chloroflexi bacterium]|nr:tetratricopeptide repeat protein [Chloroflexota bacterium]